MRLLGFWSDRRGNFALLTTIALVPLVMAIGVGLDFASIIRKKSELQRVTDAAALAIVREGKDITDQRANDIARQFLDGMLLGQYVDLKVMRGDRKFTVQAQIDGGTQFGRLFGYQTWPVTTRSTAELAYASYEIALVLDTTGSMAGGKLEAMKGAVLGLIDTMSLQVEDEQQLKFAMVPFAAFVNVGPGFGPKFKKGKMVPDTAADWLDVNASVVIPQVELAAGASRFQLYENLKQKWLGCVETRYAKGTDLDVDDTSPEATKPSTLFVPTFAVDEPDSGYPNNYLTSDAKPGDQSVTEKKKRWAKYGVATDAVGAPLAGGLLSNVTGLAIDPLTGQPFIPLTASAYEVNKNRKGPGSGCDVQPIMPLTSDFKELKKKLKDLKANGTTNITEGVAWGTRVLSPGQPFPEGSDRSKTGVEKIMVVLTDGSNVFGNNNTALGSSYSSNGYLVDGRLGIEGGGSASTNARMNLRTLAACDVAKAAGTEVYTIRLEEPNVTTGAMLTTCASGADHYFDVPTRTQLDDAFKKIGEKIVRVRLAS